MSTLVIPPSGLLVGGEWPEPRSGAHLDVVDPATHAVIRTVGHAGAADVDAAIAAARAAAPGWAATSPSERGDVLRRWADLVMAHLEELTALEAQDVGKPRSDARINIFIAHSIITYAAGAADRVGGVTLPSRDGSHLGLTLREPLGVCAVVTPWNVPALLAAANIAPAIAAGNAVVLKPSEHAPLVVLGLAALGEEAGLPPGVLNVVVGLGADAGAALSASPDIDHISFVGSTATGRAILTAAAQNLVPAKVELGGKSPNVVFADADLDAAIPVIARSFTDNAGQNCYAGSRLLVEEPIAAEVTERLVAALAEVRIGAWSDDLDMGPLVTAGQAERVRGYVSGAEADGARRVTPAGDDDGWYVTPALFDRATDDMAIVREEVFGPVAVLQTFSGLDDAIARVNDTPFGLLAAIWTNDISRALAATQRVRSGQVTVNEFANSAVIGFPFNMTKDSGFSHRGGYDGLLEYTQEKAVSIRLLDR